MLGGRQRESEPARKRLEASEPQTQMNTASTEHALDLRRLRGPSVPRVKRRRRLLRFAEHLARRRRGRHRRQAVLCERHGRAVVLREQRWRRVRRRSAERVHRHRASGASPFRSGSANVVDASTRRETADRRVRRGALLRHLSNSVENGRAQAGKRTRRRTRRERRQKDAQPSTLRSRLRGVLLGQDAVVEVAEGRELLQTVSRLKRAIERALGSISLNCRCQCLPQAVASRTSMTKSRKWPGRSECTRSRATRDRTC